MIYFTKLLCQYGRPHQLMCIFLQVSRVSDVVSVGQQISLMCIGQDVRGNIKLSLKATLPQPESETKTVVEGSAPVTKEKPNIWASPENMSKGEQLKPTLEELVPRKMENTESNRSASLIPSVVIRSAAECDEEEKFAGLSKTSKCAPKPEGTLKKASKHKKVQSSDNMPDLSLSIMLSESLSQSGGNKEITSQDEGEANLSDQNDKETGGKTTVTPQKLKLGTKVTAKIYQIRARGLVLDLGGGIRGMYKFEVRVRFSDTATAFF